jgi:uncharacterized protein YjbI with pentapeptide repeats
MAGGVVTFESLGFTWNKLDLTGVTISDAPVDLSALRASDCILPKLDMSGKTLKNAHFSHCVLTGAVFSGATMDNIVFSNECDLTGASFASHAGLVQAVFDTAVLSGADFSGAALDGATFLETLLDGTIFDDTDLTSCAFSDPPQLSNDAAHLTSFRRAKINYNTAQYCTIKKVWSCLDLSNATLVGLAPGDNLTYLRASYAVLSGLDLHGCVFDHADFTGATLVDVNFRGSPMSKTKFRGAQGARTIFAGATLIGADFGGGGQQPARLLGASFDGANLTGAMFPAADLRPAESADSKSTVSSTFRGAILAGVDFSQANLTGADLTGGVTMHGCDLSNAVLSKANLSGAQLGALGELFRLPEGQGDYQAFLDALNHQDANAVRAVLAKHISDDGADLNVSGTVRDRSWTITERNTQRVYTVLLLTSSDGVTSLVVLSPIAAASLSGAQLFDTVLTDANLYAVTASKAQIFGENVKLNGALIDLIKLADANLFGLDLREAKLFGADLSGACLINAKFNGAKFDAGVSLAGADLQGADFSDTQLDGVDFSNAGVAVDDGVFVLEVQPTDADYQAVLDDIRSTLTLCAEDDFDGAAALVADLNAGQATGLIGLLHQHGKELPPDAKVAADATGTKWIVSGAADPAQSWLIWCSPLGGPPVLARSESGALRTRFENIGTTLDPRATVEATGDRGWVIDDNSADPSNVRLGYMNYFAALEQNAKGVDGSLVIYATSLHHREPSDNPGHYAIKVRTWSATVIANPLETNSVCVGADTILPDTHKLRTDIASGKSWPQMLRAPELPAPPTCIPSPFGFCPSTDANVRRATLRSRNRQSASSS